MWRPHADLSTLDPTYIHAYIQYNLSLRPRGSVRARRTTIQHTPQCPTRQTRSRSSSPRPPRTASARPARSPGASRAKCSTLRARPPACPPRGTAADGRAECSDHGPPHVGEHPARFRPLRGRINVVVSRDAAYALCVSSVMCACVRH
ncbi:hypothetical protein BC834DRAFT_891643 [Gloeopeniophorella convolvens]|nr:hypothetical protein BC834DRAFT_891643 [Gloeopeniophorella convolvens]